MCPMRFLLVFFSALLAGYFAWRTVRSTPDADDDGLFPDDSAADNKSPEDQEFDFKKMVQNGFWVFVDMASGRYLWRNLKNINEQVKSS